MAGNPTLTSRNAFGPTMIDGGPVRDPRKHLAANQMNLLFWQVAGNGLVVPRALFFCTLDLDPTPVVTTTGQRLSWDPNGEIEDVPTWVYDVGFYTWTLPYSTGFDADGNEITLEFSIAQAVFNMPVDIGPTYTVGAHVTSATEGEIGVFDSEMTHDYIDPVGGESEVNFLLMLW